MKQIKKGDRNNFNLYLAAYVVLRTVNRSNSFHLFLIYLLCTLVIFLIQSYHVTVQMNIETTC